MASRALLIEVRFAGGHYHGAGDWPPSPFRLFQALVAGAYGGRWRSEPSEPKDAVFRWLEKLDPPLIAGPARRRAHPTTYFVPNNDLDAVGGDPRRVSEIRVGKTVRPGLFDSEKPVRYAWRFEAGEEHADRLCALAERMHTLGRGTDAAFARAEICAWDEAAEQLRSGSVAVAEPTGPGNPALDPSSPAPGSLDSLKARHEATRARFERHIEGRHLVTLFRQPPRATFRAISYDRPPARLLYDIMHGDGAPTFRPVPLARAVQLAENVRDRLARILGRSYPGPLVERVIIGRGAGEADKAARIRIVPLPSIGSRHADQAIRRVVIEVPPDCPVPAREVERAAGSVHLGVNEDGEIEREADPQLVRATDESMLEHYGIGDEGKASRLWRTVTPAALPERAARRRIDPARLRERVEQKSAAERAKEESRAASAVIHALRHAGIRASVDAVRVQREPFERRGERAEAFAPDTRFAKERLWHVEIAFADPVRGPLVIGDGRYLGLGLMVPERDALRDVLVFAVPPEAGIAAADGPALVRAARRALMALARSRRGDVPRLFSGHEADESPARGGGHDHVFLAADDSNGDGLVDRLVAAAPWACDRRAARRRRTREMFDRVASQLAHIRAGRLGVIALGRPAGLHDGDPLIGPARVWESRTRYRPTRHAGRRKDPEAAVARDLVAECGRRGLPRPEVELIELAAGPRGGSPAARARLRFAVAVRGPLILGRDSHRGGGLFAAQS